MWLLFCHSLDALIHWLAVDLVPYSALILRKKFSQLSNNVMLLSMVY